MPEKSSEKLLQTQERQSQDAYCDVLSLNIKRYRWDGLDKVLPRDVGFPFSDSD